LIPRPALAPRLGDGAATCKWQRGAFDTATDDDDASTYGIEWKFAGVVGATRDDERTLSFLKRDHERSSAL
jgi:hypothetical protein